MKTIFYTLLFLVFALKINAQIPDPCTGAGALQAISILSPCNCPEAQSGTPCNKTSFATKAASDAAINTFLTTQNNWALPTTPTNWQDVRASAMALNGTYKHEFCTEVTTGASTNKLNILNIAQVQINCNAVCQNYAIIKKVDACGTTAITPTLVVSALNPTVFYRQYIVSPNTTYIICRQLYFDGTDIDCYGTWVGGDGINSLGAQITAQHWFYYEEASSLPLSLISFNGINLSTHNLIQWDATLDLNVQKFEIEKSIDGVNFLKIGEQNTQLNNRYVFNDFDVFQNASHFYRIKIMDRNNGFSYSKIIKVSGANSKSLISVGPNPAKTKTQINLYANNNSTAIVQLINASGQVILYQNNKLISGINNISIDLSSISKGIYMLKISDGKNIYNQKLIVE